MFLLCTCEDEITSFCNKHFSAQSLFLKNWLWDYSIILCFGDLLLCELTSLILFFFSCCRITTYKFMPHLWFCFLNCKASNCLFPWAQCRNSFVVIVCGYKEDGIQRAKYVLQILGTGEIFLEGQFRRRGRWRCTNETWAYWGGETCLYSLLYLGTKVSMPSLFFKRCLASWSSATLI